MNELNMSVDTPKPLFLLDTGPLSVLCSFPLRGKPYIHIILQYADLTLPDAVITEAGRGKIIRTVSPILKAGNIQSIVTPSQPLILDTAYNRYLGAGERAVIKCSLSTGVSLVLDDQDAFIVACRFGLRPLVFQDFIVKLVEHHGMPKTVGIEIVRATAQQFPATYLTHTLDKLN